MDVNPNLSILDDEFNRIKILLNHQDGDLLEQSRNSTDDRNPPMADAQNNGVSESINSVSVFFS